MINKTQLTTLLLLISLISFGQEFPKEKSEKHIQIKGTNTFMIPPRSFEISPNFKGFYNPKNLTAVIMVITIPSPYSEITKGVNSEVLENKGMKLKNKKEIKIANLNGLLIELDRPTNEAVYSTQMLVYGNETSTTLINGVYIKDSIQLGEKIKESILTTFVATELKSNPRTALSYSINEKIGGLQFHSMVGNGMLFNRDLKIPTESDDKASLFTDKSFAKVLITDNKSFCIERIKKYPGDYSLISDKKINEVEIDNLKGFELFAKSDSEKEEMYQVILFDKDGGYYLFIGTYIPGSNNAIKEVKETIKTFKRKS